MNMSKHISTIIGQHSRLTFPTTLFSISSSFPRLPPCYYSKPNDDTPKPGIDVPDMTHPPVSPRDFPGGAPQPLSPDLDGVDGDASPPQWKRRMPPDLYPPLRNPDDQPDLPPWPVGPGEL